MSMDMSKRARAGSVSSRQYAPSAVGAPKTGKAEEKGSGAFRFWTDARRFKGSEEKCIVQQALYEAGGVRTGGYPKAAPVPGPLGYQRPADWDILWSPARLALKALPSIKPGQLVSACPGLMSLTRKRKLSLTLKQALGERAFAIMPRTFSLPDELDAWRAHVAVNSAAAAAAACAGADGSLPPQQPLWMLKTAQHLGKGLRLLPGDRALQRHLGKGLRLLPEDRVLQEAATRKLKSRGEKPYVQAQAYVADPLLINGHKSGIRVWVVVTGFNPLRAYLHVNGLVLFSSQGYDPEVGTQNDAGDVAVGHVTNYAQNQNGGVWNLPQLCDHLGADAYDTLWRRIAANCAQIVAAALPQMRAQHAALELPPGSTFELLGLDFLVDSALHPWLLEVNGTPSLAVDHEDPVVEQLIHDSKAGMVRDMVSLLRSASRFKPRYAAMRLATRTGTAEPSSGDNNAQPLLGAAAGGARAARRGRGDGDDGCSDDVMSEDGDDFAGGGAARGASGSGSASVASMVTSNTGGSGGESTAAGGSGSGDGSPANNSAHDGFALGGASVAVAGGAAGSSRGAAQAAMRKRLAEEMAPMGDDAVWAVVREELRACGGFTPLMPLFPLPRTVASSSSGSGGGDSIAGAAGGSAAAGGGSVRVVWDARDLEMPAVMRRHRRLEARGGGSDGGRAAGGVSDAQA
ncbi:hypothetical protein FOA52_009305 [Chlamydomonas sp. UWO 241]|nr:hypothetical protein FOA52_009305 [Chlamydomonas sp. UWO 241]